MSTFRINSAILLILGILSSIGLYGQSLQHPHIWVDASDKQRILNIIAQYDWAENQFNQYVQRQSSLKQSHSLNPSAFISGLSPIPGDRTSHREDLNAAAEHAVLYYLTEDEQYAQVAADVLHQYFKMISVQDPMEIKFFDPGSDNSHHIQIRELYTRIGITYDLIRPFVSKSGTTVYDLTTESRVTFDFITMQKALEVLADNVLLVGGKHSNHPLLELAGGLYVTLCMEDDVKRASYYNRFWQDEPGQNSITWMLENVPEAGNIWPEAMGYSKEVHDILLRNLMVIDRYDPDRKIIDNNKRFLDGAFVFDDFKYPNDRVIAFGDTHRHQSETDQIIRYVHAIANQKGYADYEAKAASILKAHYESTGGYNPDITTERLNWDTPIELLWGVNIPESVNAADISYASTGRIEHAGVVMQRNDVEQDNKEFGLMYYTGGANYVHAHATGIDFEIYGVGYVIGPEFGRESYGSDIHEQYAVSPAAHNTVIANGKGGRGPKTNGNSTWQNIVDEIKLEACEPKPFAERIADNFSFSCQFLDDSFNEVQQQRTNAIIRTSPTSGYYVDIFRSKGEVTNDFHDYLFHGLGDELQLCVDGSDLTLTQTPDRYQTDQGDERKQPGWRWYTDTKTSGSTAKSVNARFDLNKKGIYLHAVIPEGIEREYSTALAPPSRYVIGYSSVDTKMLIMRKYGEAWDQPFAAIYEPSGSASSSIQSTSGIYSGGKMVGLKVVSLVGGNEILDYIIANDSDGQLVNRYGIRFKGRFAIVRVKVKTDKTEVSAYIGKGETLTFENVELVSDNEGKAFSQFTLDYVLEEPEEVLSNGWTHVTDSVYPNPSGTGIFQLTTSVSFKVYNLSGVLVAEGHGQSIDISDQPKGVFILHINDHRIKLIK